MFMFDGCHHSWAAEILDKYENDWKYLTYVFAKSKFPVTEKLRNRALVIPLQGKSPNRQQVITCTNDKSVHLPAAV